MDKFQRELLSSTMITKQAIAKGDFQTILTEVSTVKIELSTLLILDMTSFEFDYPTVILDKEHGLIASKQRTRQLIACFLDQSPLNLIFPRVIKRLMDMDHRVLPLSFGWFSFVPLSSATHGEADWVGLYELDRYAKVADKEQLTWADYRAQVDYRGDFEALVHVASLYSEAFINLLTELVTFCGADLKRPPHRFRFQSCDCPTHCQLKRQKLYVDLFNDTHLKLITECFYPESEWPDLKIRLDYRQAAWRRYARLEKYS